MPSETLSTGYGTNRSFCLSVSECGKPFLVNFPDVQTEPNKSSCPSLGEFIFPTTENLTTRSLPLHVMVNVDDFPAMKEYRKRSEA